LRKSPDKLRVRQQIDGPIILRAIASAECLSDTLAKASLSERSVPKVGRYELLQVAGRDRNFRHDLNTANVTWKVHTVVSASSHKVPC
jgi:hypothetical protein